MASQDSAVGEQRIFCISLQESRGLISRKAGAPEENPEGATSHIYEDAGCGKWLQ